MLHFVQKTRIFLIINLFLGQELNLALLPLSGLEVFFFQRNRSGLVVDLLVESAGVTDNLSCCCSSPECCCCCRTVPTAGSIPLTGGDPGVLWFNERPVGSVHLVIETTGVA